MSRWTLLKHARFVVFLALTSTAQPATITFEFTGTVTQVPVDEVYFDIAPFDPV
jgi:hypothetical protein